MFVSLNISELKCSSDLLDEVARLLITEGFRVIRSESYMKVNWSGRDLYPEK